MGPRCGSSLAMNLAAVGGAMPMLRGRSRLVLAGQSRWFRSGILSRVSLFWSILRIRMNWKKPLRGSSIDWLGCQLQMHACGVDVTLFADKTADLLKSFDEFNAAYAHCWGWVSCLEALASSDRDHRSAARFRPKALVFKRRVSFAMRWLQALVKTTSASRAPSQ